MICVSLPAFSYEDVREALGSVEFAEIRLDKNGLTVEDLKKLFSTSPVPLIATCRPGTKPDEERLALLAAAVESGAAYVDVESTSSPEYFETVRKLAREKGCKLIGTYHNLQETPMKLVLAQVIEELFDRGADIAKVVCRVRNIQECSRLLSLYETKKNIMALGLGELGVLTRIAAPFLGAPFTYAALAPGKETAEGQPDLETLKALMVLLKRV